MKKLFVIGSICVPLYLLAQGFGSFSHDQPFLAVDGFRGIDPYAVDLYEYWSLNSTNTIGTSATNFGEFGRDMFITPDGSASPGVVAGISGNGRQFGGNPSGTFNPYFTTHKDWSGYNSWSVSMWIKPFAETANTEVFSIWKSSGVENQILLLGYSSSNMSFQVLKYPENSPSYYVMNMYSTNVIPTNTWIHLAFGYDASGITTFVGQANLWWQTNAGPRHTLFTTNVISPFTLATTGLSFANVNSGGQAFNGVMDEIGWWDRTLSTNEITAFYGGGTNPLVYNAGWFNNGYITPPITHSNLFDPSTISSFLYGFDALRPESVVQSNTVVGPNQNNVNVGYWFSYITNLWMKAGLVAYTGGVTNYPTYYTNGFGTNLDTPRLRFDLSGLGVINSRNFGSITNTVNLVTRINGSEVGGSIFFAGIGFTDGDEFYSFPVGSLLNFQNFNLTAGGAQFVGPTTVVTNVPYVVTIQYATGDYKVWTNGVLYVTSTSPIGPVMNFGRIGAYYNSSTGKYDGGSHADIPRLWCWGKILTSTELSNVVASCRGEYKF